MDLTLVKTFERGSPSYPDRLEMLPDPPDRLFVLGNLPENPMIAIVGSRNADAGACRCRFWAGW